MKAAVKLLLCLLLATSTILAFGHTNSYASSGFTDISTGHRAYKEITYLAQGQIVSGNNGKYEANRHVTRAEAAAMIGRALNLDGTKRKTSFKDVSAGNFASGYIQSAVEKKILSGYPGGIFKPYENVTRGEMAVMISKAFGYDFGNTISGAAKALTSRGIAQGLPGGSFGADQSIIRADFAIFLARAIDHKLRLKPSISYSGQMYVNASSLNLRTGPSTNYGSVASLKRNEKVTLGYKVGTWTYIKSSAGKTGFVKHSYLKTTIQGGDDTSNPSSPLASQVIVIDPGHGAHDPGAVGYGVKEKDVVLDTGLRLNTILAKTPFKVQMTRKNDTFLELSERVAFAKRVKGNTFVSIHANAFNGSASGTETWYYSRSSTNPHVKDSKLLAEKIQTRLVGALNTKDRGEKETESLYVLKYNNMPATLVELGFIDNKADNAKLNSPTYRQKAAEAIYLGILDYYKAKGFNVTSLYNVVK